MQNFLIDSHCHIHYPQFTETMDGLVKRANENLVKYMITVATDHNSHRQILPLIEKYENIYGSVGVHPCDGHRLLDDDMHEDDLYEYLMQHAQRKKIVALGETGLDFYVSVKSEKNTRILQEKFFLQHINVSKTTGLPVIIHTRNAEKDTIRILKSENFGNAVFHCFTGSQKLADAGLEMGLHISFSGIITFKNCDELRAVVKNTPLDRILVETDSPYLSPEPVRKIHLNEPSHVLHVAQKIAEIHETTLENVMMVTTENCFNLFKKMTPNQQH